MTNVTQGGHYISNLPFQNSINYFTTNFTNLYVYVYTQDLLPGGISSICLRSAQDYRSKYYISMIVPVFVLFLYMDRNLLRTDFRMYIIVV